LLTRREAKDLWWVAAALIATVLFIGSYMLGMWLQ
jgi:hypothetical protein